jgi:ribonuclease M5
MYESTARERYWYIYSNNTGPPYGGLFSEVRMITEVIVVEGRDDLCAVKRSVEAEVITTGGFGINRKTLELIAEAQRRKGVIIFTDPDYAGERIRDIISSHVPGCKHAFLPKDLAIGKDGSIGVENASEADIRAALSAAREQHAKDAAATFTMADLLSCRLAGTPDAGLNRDRLGEYLGIGLGSAKKILNRLNGFGISKEEFFAALDKMAGGR